VSPGAIEFVPGGSRYRLLDRSGREITHGVFTYAAPDRVAAGMDAYLIETVSTLFSTPSDIAKAEVQPATRPAQTSEALLRTDDVEWREGPDGGLEAIGKVVNDTGSDVGSAFVCVIFVGRDGQILGGVYDLTDVRELAPGASGEFATEYPGTGPVDRHAVGRVIAIAYELEIGGR
jgi:hypothetical protein